VVLGFAIYDGATDEIFIRLAVLIWIFANIWWMTGEVEDWQTCQCLDGDLYLERTYETQIILDTGLCLLGVYYLVVRPFKLFKSGDPDALERYDSTGLPSRWPLLFSNWREYENIHILFWMGKDCAWANGELIMWLIFVVPTVGIAWDLTWVSSQRKHMLLDHFHYLAQLIWVMSNAVWAGGEFFDPDHDYPWPLASTYVTRNLQYIQLLYYSDGNILRHTPEPPAY
jgi:hypothetical protein